MEEQRLALGVGESGHGIAQPLPQLARFASTGGGGRPRPLGLLNGIGGPQAQIAAVVEHPVAHDAEQPTGESAGIAALRQPPTVVTSASCASCSASSGSRVTASPTLYAAPKCERTSSSAAAGVPGQRELHEPRGVVTHPLLISDTRARENAGRCAAVEGGRDRLAGADQAWEFSKP